MSTIKLVDSDFKSGEALPEAPYYFSLHALEVWNELLPTYQEAGILDPPTISLFQNYCMAAGIVREAEAIMSVDGRLIENRNHPQLLIFEKYAKLSLSYEMELNRRKEKALEAKAKAQTESEADSNWSGEKERLLA
jgi:phage terminase small subunit